MLVLVSFGLVLLAAILLVIGLLAGSGLALVYVSIACTVLAGVVLVVAARVGDAEYEPAGPTFGPRPAPPPPAAPAAAGAGSTATGWQSPSWGTQPTQEAPSPPEPAPTAPMPVVATPPEKVAEPAPTEPEEEEAIFPIADYDDLRVAEILPLLPELYDDEIDMVEARELSGKARASVLDRLADLQAGLAPPEEVAEPAPTEPEEEEAIFPIADYDDLRVAEILPLLPELYDDEIDMVEARELSGKARASVLDRLADLQAGLAPPEEVAELELFPIADYDDLRAAEVRGLLGELTEDELATVRRREVAGANRRSVVGAIDRELGKLSPLPTPVSTRRAPAERAPAKRAPAKRGAAKKAGVKTRARTAGRAAKKATKRAATKAAPRKSTARKSTARKSTARKSTARKSTARKSTARKSTARR